VTVGLAGVLAEESLQRPRIPFSGFIFSDQPEIAFVTLLPFADWQRRVEVDGLSAGRGFRADTLIDGWLIVHWSFFLFKDLVAFRDKLAQVCVSYDMARVSESNVSRIERLREIAGFETWNRRSGHVLTPRRHAIDSGAIFWQNPPGGVRDIESPALLTKNGSGVLAAPAGWMGKMWGRRLLKYLPRCKLLCPN
jgi:hypothetical protein